MTLEVPFALLQAIAELSEEELRRALGHLQASEFLYETNLFPELEYTFKHALTHKVAYGSLLQEWCRSLHAHIVAAGERLYANRLTEQAEWLAHNCGSRIQQVWKGPGIRTCVNCAYRVGVDRSVFSMPLIRVGRPSGWSGEIRPGTSGFMKPLFP
jgi:hypothetical protein